MVFKQNCAKPGLKRTFFWDTLFSIGHWLVMVTLNQRMADNVLNVMHVCDHYVGHGIVVNMLKTFMISLLVIKVIVLWGDHVHIQVAVQDDRSLGRPCSYSSYACW